MTRDRWLCAAVLVRLLPPWPTQAWASGISRRTFRLLDQQGVPVSLSELLTEGVVVLYFYPKDDTPGCTIEACHFRQEHEEFVRAGARVVGISSDDVESHRRFADKYALPYPLLFDEGGELRKRLGVPKTLGLVAGRVTYVVDRNRVIRYVFSSQMRPKRHVEEALRVVQQLA